MPEQRFIDRNGFENVVSRRLPARAAKSRILRARPPDYSGASDRGVELQPGQKALAPCDLCGVADHLTAHHLVPRCRGGGLVAHLCVLCHEQVHRLWSNDRLAAHLNTLRTLRAAYDWWAFGFLARGIPVYGHESTESLPCP